MFRFLLALINVVVLVLSQDIELNLYEELTDNSLSGLDATPDIIDPFGEGTENIPTDLLLSWQARRSIRKTLAQMPCGWPELNIPPLAPYVSENHQLTMKNSVVSSDSILTSIWIDGLENMDIKRLTIGVVLRRVNFDFNFPNITLKGNFDTSTIVGLQQILGLEFSVKGTGHLDLSLENLRVTGSLRYKIPIFYGTPRIFKLQADVSLGNIRSELKGSINEIPLSEAHNELIRENILKLVNDYKIVWKNLLEQRLTDLINSELEGKTLWNILTLSRSPNEDNCKSENLKEIDIEELHQLLLRKGTRPQ